MNQTMTSFYVRLSFALFSMFTVLGIVLSALGTTQPIHPALHGFGVNCRYPAIPCWYGIEAVMRLEESQSILEHLNYVLDYTGGTSSGYEYERYCLTNANPSCVVIGYFPYPETHPTYYISVDVQNVNLGEALNVFGTPLRVSLSDTYHEYWLEYENIVVNISEGRISPFTDVESISLNRGTQSTGELSWHGFVSIWRYCEFEPTNNYCHFRYR